MNYFYAFSLFVAFFCVFNVSILIFTNIFMKYLLIMIIEAIRAEVFHSNLRAFFLHLSF